ncbi:hypothetical protein FRC10_000376 [Ceratobasidium sp. 414]|nr:hypothetical protein FRC10_000376 [Ceratobasidium sp. 414]
MNDEFGMSRTGEACSKKFGLLLCKAKKTKPMGAAEMPKIMTIGTSAEIGRLHNRHAAIDAIAQTSTAGAGEDAGESDEEAQGDGRDVEEGKEGEEDEEVEGKEGKEGKVGKVGKQDEDGQEGEDMDADAGGEDLGDEDEVSVVGTGKGRVMDSPQDAWDALDKALVEGEEDIPEPISTKSNLKSQPASHRSKSWEPAEAAKDAQHEANTQGKRWHPGTI